MRALFVLVALPTLATLQACLITQHVQIDPPGNAVPSIADPLARPTGYHPIASHVDLSDLEPNDAGTATSIPLEVTVLDTDVDQVLQYQVWLNYPTPRASVFGVRPIPADGTDDEDRTRRRVSFELPLDTGIDCTRVELFVTGQFDIFDLRAPQEEGDVAVATWWIVRDGTVPISACQEAP